MLQLRTPVKWFSSMHAQVSLVLYSHTYMCRYSVTFAMKENLTATGLAAGRLADKYLKYSEYW